MENIIIVKVFRSEYDNDWHDLNMDLYQNKMDEIKMDFLGKGTKLFVSVCAYLDICEFDTVASVEYTDELSEKEKKKIVELIKMFSEDAEYGNDGKNWYITPKDTLKLIEFVKIDRENIFLI